MAEIKIPIVIDGAKTIEELANRALDEYSYKGRTIREWADLIASGDVPASDVVEVVRCEDCKHAKRNDKHPDRPLICYLTRRVGEVDGKWFCADGKRRGTEAEP